MEEGIFVGRTIILGGIAEFVVLVEIFHNIGISQIIESCPVMGTDGVYPDMGTNSLVCMCPVVDIHSVVGVSPVVVGMYPIVAESPVVCMCLVGGMCPVTCVGMVKYFDDCVDL
jgi:hypothetical protein